MEMKRYYLAIDIGASSGRHIVGWREDGEIKAREATASPTAYRSRTAISSGTWMRCFPM
ncbi:MAG: hypothetical protein ACLRR6_11495 [Oscillospiraceae bacterium]